MDKKEFERLGLKIGQKFDLKTKNGSPCSLIYDGIREYNEYGVSETYILYHRLDGVKLEDIVSITPLDREDNKNNSDEQEVEKVDNQSDQIPISEIKKPSHVERKYACSCGKTYANAGALWRHTKQTGHLKA